MTHKNINVTTRYPFSKKIRNYQAVLRNHTHINIWTSTCIIGKHLSKLTIIRQSSGQIQSGTLIQAAFYNWRTTGWLRLHQLLCLRQHVTTNTQNIVLTRPKSASWGIFDHHLTLDLLTQKFKAFIRAPKSISGENLVKFHQQICELSC